MAESLYDPTGNWFIALRSAAAGAFSSALEAELAASPPAVRAFKPMDRHFTLSFLGRCGEDEARASWEALIDADFPGFAITLGEVVPMGPKRRYSALSALVDEGRAPLEAWMERARRVGPVDLRAVKAHLTLARPQRKANEQQRAAALEWGRSLPTKGTPMQLDQLALFAWSKERSRQLFEVVTARSAQ